MPLVEIYSFCWNLPLLLHLPPLFLPYLLSIIPPKRGLKRRTYYTGWGCGICEARGRRRGGFNKMNRFQPRSFLTKPTWDKLHLDFNSFVAWIFKVNCLIDYNLKQLFLIFKFDLTIKRKPWNEHWTTVLATPFMAQLPLKPSENITHLGFIVYEKNLMVMIYLYIYTNKHYLYPF